MPRTDEDLIGGHSRTHRSNRVGRAFWIAFIEPVWPHLRPVLVTSMTVVVKIIFPALVACVLTVYIAGLPLRPGLALGLMFFGLYFLIMWTREETVKPPWRFHPFRVQVTPNWPRILIDFKLATEGQWYRLASAWRLYEDRTADENRQTPFAAVSEHRVLRNGISFTVLEPSDTFGEPLVYSESKPHFRKSLRFEEIVGAVGIVEQLARHPSGIPDMQRPGTFAVELRGEAADDEIEEAKAGPWPDPVFRVFFIMDQGPNGYDLGLSVPENWWQTVKDACPDPISVRPASGNFVELVLATVPNLEFAWYHHPIRRDSRLHRRWFKRVLGRSEEERARMGWGKPKIEAGSHSAIEHRYFHVSHCAIDKASELYPYPTLFFST